MLKMNNESRYEYHHTHNVVYKTVCSPMYCMVHVSTYAIF